MKRIPLAIQPELPKQSTTTRSPMAKTSVFPTWQRKVRDFAHRYRLIKYLRVLMALFWFGPWRKLAIRYYQWLNRNEPLPQTALTLFPDFAITQAANQLKADGLALGLQLPESQIEAILAYCDKYGATGYYNHDVHCLALRTIVRDPVLLAVARQYLGAEPILYSTQLYWTHPPALEADQQRSQKRTTRFHYDLGDFKALIVFFYLTDVTADCGPHVTIQGTHQHKSFRQMLTRYLSDPAAQAQYPDRIKTLTGPRGYGFFSDIACYHKHAYGARTRLMLSITYVLQRQPGPRVPKTY